MKRLYLSVLFLLLPMWLSKALENIEKYRGTPHAETILYHYALHMQNPTDVKAAEELAYVLAYAEYDLDAFAIYNQILQRDPLRAEAWSNGAFMLMRVGYVKEAIELYQRSLLCKDNATTWLNLAIAYLTNGDLERGFKAYEYRWRVSDQHHESFERQWHGEELCGKRICVHAEQGFGDTFMFMRYLPLLKEMGARVIFVVQPALKKVVQLCPFVDEVVTFDDPLPSYDYFCALLSLPTIFKTRLETIPVQIPYLYADPLLVQEWKNKIDHTTINVGICWQGKADYKESCSSTFLASRSCTLDCFRPLASIPGVRLYSLQKMYGLDQLGLCEAALWLELFDESFDAIHGRFMDSAAVMQNLDLVITIDTSIAHLAAGLGKPTWILIPEPADWRWFRDRTDTPWYPNVRLFRQQIPGDWTTVMKFVAYELQKQMSYNVVFENLSVD